MSNASAQADLAECPFCGREVDAELVSYGGKCPYCFGDIPGEEAPTDPGEAKKKAEHKEIAAKMQRGRLWPLLFLGTFLLVPVCGAAFLLLRPTPPMPVLNLDDGENSLDIEIIRPEVPEVAVVETPADPGKAADPKHPKHPGDSIAKLGNGGTNSTDPIDTSKLGSPGASDPGHTPGPRGGDIATSTGPATPEIKMGTGTTSTGFSGPGISIQRRAQEGVTLTDDNLIIEMAKATVTQELPKLRYQCYEPALKRDENIGGAWLLNFTVKPNGTVGSATVAAKPGTTANAELETCIVQKVTLWRFQPIKAELPVAKSVVFKSS